MLSILSALAFAGAALALPTEPGNPVLGVTIGNPPAGPATTTSATGPNPTQVYINGITYGGSGCPQGSVGSFISDDRSTFTLIFDSFVASIGPGVPVTENRLNCQLNIDLQYPSGFQYSILDTEFRGYAALDAGVTGVQEATYYFSGSSAQASSQTNFVGPTSGDYEVTDSVPFSSTVWSPCGAALPLNINSQVRLTSNTATASGQLTDDSVDGKIQYVVGVQWQACKPPKE